MNTEVEQRRKKRAHNNHDTCLVDVPENCIFDILVRLPLETLCSSRIVCKSWFEIISSPDFRNAHLHRSDTTTRGLIFLTQVKNYSSPPPNKVFSVESSSMLVGPHSASYIKFMETKDGKSTMKDYNAAVNGEMVAACNGLIVLKHCPKTAGLIILNPVTRELEDIPLGTLSSSYSDLYGLAFCHASRRYKLLHLFTKERFSDLGCEIMDIGSGSWRAVDMPLAKEQHFFLQNPVFAMGALHWVQLVKDHDGQCMVSMPLDDEKFKTMAIPETGGNQYYHLSLIFAMGEFAGYASRHERSNEIGVWILRGLGGECGWEKQYNIDVGSEFRYYNMTTLLCYGGDSGHAAFIFRRGGDGRLYAYDDRHSQPLRKIENIDYDVVDTNYWRIFSHVNSLVSWRS